MITQYIIIKHNDITDAIKGIFDDVMYIIDSICRMYGLTKIKNNKDECFVYYNDKEMNAYLLKQNSENTMVINIGKNSGRVIEEISIEPIKETFDKAKIWNLGIFSMISTKSSSITNYINQGLCYGIKYGKINNNTLAKYFIEWIELIAETVELPKTNEELKDSLIKFIELIPTEGKLPRIDINGNSVVSLNKPPKLSVSSEPLVLLEPSEPSVSFEPSEPLVSFEPSEPLVSFEPSEPPVSFEPSEPLVSFEPSEPPKLSVLSEPPKISVSSDIIAPSDPPVLSIKQVYKTTQVPDNRAQQFILSTINVLVGIGVVIVCIGGFYFMGRLYKKRKNKK